MTSLYHHSRKFLVLAFSSISFVSTLPSISHTILGSTVIGNTTVGAAFDIDDTLALSPGKYNNP
jgi:hypothetical protein